MSGSQDLSQDVHDYLLANKPEGARHDSMKCPLCTQIASHEEDGVAEEKILSQEQHEALLKAAVTEAQAKAQANVDAEILDLNEKLAKAEATIAEKDSVIESLREQEAARVEAERLDALGDERIAQVKEVANFTDEQLAARKSKWATMSDEDFKQTMEDYRAIASAAPSTKAPESTFDGTRQTAGDQGTEVSSVRELFGSGAFMVAANK